MVGIEDDFGGVEFNGVEGVFYDRRDEDGRLIFEMFYVFSNYCLEFYRN